MYDNILKINDNLKHIIIACFLHTIAFFIKAERWDFVPMAETKISLPKDKIAEFCQQNQIRKLSLFGSVLRDDFGPDSDVDILVEFEPGTRVGLIRLSGLEIELSNIIGRKVDLNTPGFLSKDYRHQIVAEADVHYDAA